MEERGDEGWVRDRLARWRAQRDGEALGELVKWQRDRAYAVARRILNSGADAEDAVQQACAKLLTRTQGFDSPEDFKLAVYRAVAQCALDMARANRVRNNLEKAMSQIEKSSAPLPERAAEHAEALRLVFEELERMPEEARALVVLCYQEGLSVSEAAQVLAVPRETLRDRLAASLADLRQRVTRRGVALSLLLLVGVLQQGSAMAAPASLCHALDGTLAGAPCATVPAAAAVQAPPAALLAGTGISAAAFGAKLAVGSALVMTLALALAAWGACSGGSSARRSRTAPTDIGQVGNGGVAATAAPSSGAEAPPSPHGGEGNRPPRAAPESANPNPQSAVAAAGRAAGNENAEKKQEEELAPAQLPAAVRAAASGAVKGVVLIEADRKTKDGVTVYEIKGKVGDKVYEIKVSAEGKILAVDEGDNNDEDEDNDGGAKPAVKPPEPPKGDF